MAGSFGPTQAKGEYEVTIEPLPQPAGKACLQIQWQRHDDWSDWFTHSAGCYLLRSNLTDVDAGTLWKRYIQLTEAEWAFRITKDELGIRPIWHHKADRVKAHILVCFLAYVLWKTLGHWMQRSGLGDAPRTLIDEIAKLKSGDVVLPARGRKDHAERTVRLRCVTSPDAAQKGAAQPPGRHPPPTPRPPGRVPGAATHVVKTLSKKRT